MSRRLPMSVWFLADGKWREADVQSRVDSFGFFDVEEKGGEYYKLALNIDWEGGSCWLRAKP